jgi:phosphoenolpyruvate synthase/pyruvate phosphate dikinase
VSGPFAGGKRANRGEITRAGIPVPPGFVVATAASLAARATSCRSTSLAASYKDVVGTGPLSERIRAAKAIAARGRKR